MAKIAVELLDDHVETDELAQFIEKSSNGTLFHRPKFLTYHEKDKFPPDRFKVIHYVFRYDKRIIAFLPGMLVLNDHDQWEYKSPVGSSYGGFVIPPEITFVEAEEIVQLFINSIQEKTQSIEVGLTAFFYGCPNPEVINYFHYLLLKNGFHIEKSDLLLVYKTDTSRQIEKRFNRKTYGELQQAFRYNLEKEISSIIDNETYSLLLEARNRLGVLGIPPTHSFEDLQKIGELFPENIKVFKARHDGILAAAIICFVVNKYVLNTFYIFDSLELRKYKPNHYNYYQVLKWATENNYQYVDFGPSTMGYVPSYPLIFYKEKYDAKPFQRLTYKRESVEDK